MDATARTDLRRRGTSARPLTDAIYNFCHVFIFCFVSIFCHVFISCIQWILRGAIFVVVGGIAPVSRRDERGGTLFRRSEELRGSRRVAIIFCRRVVHCTVFALRVRPEQVPHTCVNPIDDHHARPHMCDGRAPTGLQLLRHHGPKIPEDLWCQLQHQTMCRLRQVDRHGHAFDGRRLRGDNLDKRGKRQDRCPSGIYCVASPFPFDKRVTINVPLPLDVLRLLQRAQNVGLPQGFGSRAEDRYEAIVDQQLLQRSVGGDAMEN